ncbi:hypothetical protein PHAVU_010G035500 [Phaseolus vulgaris]|uniref:Uncharacterized protein n=1 Tax=Phaseolus vulgaris TaxID=3885 RepID=V7AL38_PHAVU|nr:hypothetical protein PHAVU_010G035500g [Phaseolus vulgaris]ESW06292.1 hypothetical protein PHAVU_010G035500g [Phaseolus vulgaris]
MASNRISSIWVILFVFVLGLLCARASSPLNVAHASGFHASSYEKIQTKRILGQQRKLLPERAADPCCHNYHP